MQIGLEYFEDSLKYRTLGTLNNNTNELPGSKRSLLFWIVQILVFAGLLWYLKKVGIQSIISKFASLKVAMLIFGMSLVISMNLIRPWRSWIVLKKMGVPIKWWILFRWSQEAFFLSIITPGKVGDLYRAYRIESEYRKTGSGVLSTILDRWIDLVIVLVFGLGAMMLQPYENLGKVRDVTGALFLGVVFVTFGFTSSNRFRSAVKKVFCWIPNSWVQEKLDHFSAGLNNAFRILDARSLMQFLMISLFIWFFFIVGFNLLFRSVDVNLGLLPFLSCVALVLIAQSLPITLFGFGTREATLVFYLGNYGLGSGVALAISSLFVLTTFASLCVSGVFWLLRDHNQNFKGSQ